MSVLSHLADECAGGFTGDFQALQFSAERTILRSGEIGVQLLLILIRCLLQRFLVPWRARRIQPAYALAWPKGALWPRVDLRPGALRQADVPNVGWTRNRACSTVGPPSAARWCDLTRLLEIDHFLTD
jgi:hypothetical protein